MLYAGDLTETNAEMDRDVAFCMIRNESGRDDLQKYCARIFIEHFLRVILFCTSGGKDVNVDEYKVIVTP